MKRFAWALLLLAGCSGGNRPAVERAVNAVTSPKFPKPAPHEGPDAAFINLKWGTMLLGPGAAGTVELDVVNRGQQPFGPFRVGVYGNLGSVVTGKKQLLGTAEVPGYEGKPRHVVVPFTAPGTAGHYAVDVELDDLKQVPGDDTSNNRSAPERLIVK